MFSREVPWTFYCKMGQIPATASSQKLQEKKESPRTKYGALSWQKTYSFIYNKNVQSDKNVSEWILHQFVKILEGGLWTMDPSYTGKNPPHQDFHDKKIPTPNRLGIYSNAPFASGFHQKKKKTGGTLPLTREENNPLFILGEHTLALCISSGSSPKSHTILEKILKSNRQKRLRMHHLHHFVKNFLGETTTPFPSARE